MNHEPRVLGTTRGLCTTEHKAAHLSLSVNKVPNTYRRALPLPG